MNIEKLKEIVLLFGISLIILYIVTSLKPEIRTETYAVTLTNGTVVNYEHCGFPGIAARLNCRNGKETTDYADNMWLSVKMMKDG